MAKTRVEIDAEKLARVRGHSGHGYAPRDDRVRVKRGDQSRAVRDLVLSAEDGAFSALLEPHAEDRLWG